MVNKKVEATIKKQINAEIYSAYLYVEEESNAENIMRQLKLPGDSGLSLYMLDRELDQCVFVPLVQAQSRCKKYHRRGEKYHEVILQCG